MSAWRHVWGRLAPHRSRFGDDDLAAERPLDDRATVALLLVLTAVTGLVDAVSYLRLGHVFVANMTGNVVFLGLSLDPGSDLSPAASVTAIAGFLAGAVLGGRLGTILGDRPRVWLGVAFSFQALLVAVVAVAVGLGLLPYRGRLALVTIVVLAVSSGLQNATVRRMAVRDMTTTVLTMALVGVAADSVLAGGGGGKSQRRIASVAAMLAGAAAGALMLRVTVAGVLALAAVLLALVALSIAAQPRSVHVSI
ncbi:uncharacterized membrane protein YoaK (UPF0700 family) [Kribbella steppae]|uniref:Uncharacterized membrane protein YoaK (UPF0700 family) n=1 Tax=Kribbella steppae TaxID=2512223 RepID=A0A4R2H3I3_9ACTN|nr:YoaK family protein [Kribbella steppae]TCO19714.1 uncharacterized membrane protein YoaK (UPF0700 family) [Kribbella steppae]